jgi:hypothetical protein
MPDPKQATGKILRRCDVCGKFHAAYLLTSPDGVVRKVCYSCWKAATSQPIPPPKP